MVAPVCRISESPHTREPLQRSPPRLPRPAKPGWESATTLAPALPAQQRRLKPGGLARGLHPCPPVLWPGQEGAMIRGTKLYGRPVIDLDAGENLGKLTEVWLDPPSQCVAWLTVTPWEA